MLWSLWTRARTPGNTDHQMPAHAGNKQIAPRQGRFMLHAAWDISYHLCSPTIHSAALIKQFAGLGPEGAGATQPIGTTRPRATLFLDSSATFGADTHGAAFPKPELT
jgi:hypothetical protein